MKYKSSLIALCVLVGFLCLAPAQAKEDENEGIARVVMITAKDGHDEALIRAITDYHHWVANFEGHHEYTWYRIMTGENSGKYIARTPEHNWSDFDAKYDWQEEAGVVFQNNVQPHIQNMEVHFTMDMKSVSFPPESFDGYTHYVVQDWYVKNGQYGKFRRGLERINETLKAGGFKDRYMFFSVETGGYQGQVRLVGANKGWAGMSEQDPSFFSIMSESLGGPEEFEAFMSDWGSSFKAGANWVVQLMPDASSYTE